MGGKTTTRVANSEYIVYIYIMSVLESVLYMVGIAALLSALIASLSILAALLPTLERRNSSLVQSAKGAVGG